MNDSLSTVPKAVSAETSASWPPAWAATNRAEAAERAVPVVELEAPVAACLPDREGQASPRGLVQAWEGSRDPTLASALQARSMRLAPSAEPRAADRGSDSEGEMR